MSRFLFALIILIIFISGCMDADKSENTEISEIITAELNDPPLSQAQELAVRDLTVSNFENINNELLANFSSHESNSYDSKLSERAIVNKLTNEEKHFLKKAARISQKLQQRIKADAMESIRFQEITPHKQIITLAEAEARYGIDSYHNASDSVLLISGDIRINGDLNDDWMSRQLEGLSWDGNLYGVIVDGNAIVSGSIIDDNRLELFVVGNLLCDYLFSGDGFINIRGDADIKLGIYGEYNDGVFSVYGKLKTPYIISRDHSMPRESIEDFIYIEGGNGTEKDNIVIGSSKGSGIGWDWHYYKNSSDLFVSRVWTDEGEFSVDIFFDLVRQGRNPFISIE